MDVKEATETLQPPTLDPFMERLFMLSAFYTGMKSESKFLRYASLAYVGFNLMKYFKQNGTLAGNPLGAAVRIDTGAVVDRFAPGIGSGVRELLTSAGESYLDLLHRGQGE